MLLAKPMIHFAVGHLLFIKASKKKKNIQKYLHNTDAMNIMEFEAMVETSSPSHRLNSLNYFHYRQLFPHSLFLHIPKIFSF